MARMDNGALRLSQLTPLPESAESIFFQAHSFIRDIDGMHADEALDELCKIIQIKMIDEKITGVNDFLKLQKGIYTSVSDFYSSVVEFQKEVFKLHISDNYHEKKIRLSSSALYKVVELFQNYNFIKTPLDIKGRAFQNLFIPSVRAGMGQYFTPLPIVKFIIECVRPTAYDYILDPFCGSGHFLTESIKFVQENEPDSYAAKNIHSKYFGIEKSERMARVATTDFKLSGSEGVNIECNDSLLPFENYTCIKAESFDYVLTNPPFGSLLGRESLSFLDEFHLSKDKKSIPLEILGIERSIQFLKTGGKLVIVIPDGILVNTQTKYVREWLKNVATINAIVSLPPETFTPYGANVKTSILFLEKKNSNKENAKTFLGKFNDSLDSMNSNEFINMKDSLKKHLESEGW
ncbi:TPA: HsdM family class I SAM-dependent methyltransferase [Serratia fonticola]